MGYEMFPMLALYSFFINPLNRWFLASNVNEPFCHG
jgi:hypothetical protein